MEGVSIIIPCYNDSKYLGEAIRSALPFGEVIVVNDGSTDDTETVARSFPQAKYISIPHSGLGMARNAGIAIATNDLILPLDCDDILVNIPEPKSDVTYGNYVNFDGDAEWIMRPNPNITFDQFKINNQLYPSSLFRKRVWDAYHFSDLTDSEDWDFWLNAMRNGFSFSYVDIVIAKHRIRPDSMWERVISEGRIEQVKNAVLKRNFQ